MKAKLFFPGVDSGGLLCDCSISELNVVAQAPQETYLFPLRQVSLTLGGLDDCQIVLTLGERVLYLPRETWEGKLRQLKLNSVTEALRGARLQARWRARRWTATLLAGAMILLAGVVGLVGLSDLLIEHAVRGTPIQVEVEFGEVAGQSIIGTQVEFKGQSLKQLQSLFDELGSDFSQRGFRWRLVVVESPEENAFALPGGTVVLYTGLLKAASGPEEVAGVLAHEIHHVVLRHSLRHIYGDLRWQLPLLLLGEEHTMRALVTQRSTQLASLSYSREMELQADAGGFDLLVSRHIDPHGLVNFFERSGRKESVGQTLLKFQSTHPPSSERREALEARLKALGPGQWTTPSLNWKQLKEELQAR